jgi:hypothetical protein
MDYEDIFSQMNPTYILTPDFRVNFNLILWRSPTSFKLSRPLIFCQHFSSFMRTTSLAHRIVIYFMLLKVFSEACKLWSFTLYSFSQPVIYSCPLCLNTLLCKLFSNIINPSHYPRVIILRCKSTQKIVNYKILYFKPFWLHIKSLEDRTVYDLQNYKSLCNNQYLYMVFWCSQVYVSTKMPRNCLITSVYIQSTLVLSVHARLHVSDLTPSHQAFCKSGYRNNYILYKKVSIFTLKIHYRRI